MSDYRPGSRDRVPDNGGGCAHVLLGVAVLVVLTFAALILGGGGGNGGGAIVLIVLMLALFNPSLILFGVFAIGLLIFAGIVLRKRSSGERADRSFKTAQGELRRPGSFGSRHR